VCGETIRVTALLSTGYALKSDCRTGGRRLPMTWTIGGSIGRNLQVRHQFLRGVEKGEKGSCLVQHTIKKLLETPKRGRERKN